MTSTEQEKPQPDNGGEEQPQPTEGGDEGEGSEEE